MARHKLAEIWDSGEGYHVRLFTRGLAVGRGLVDQATFEEAFLDGVVDVMRAIVAEHDAHRFERLGPDSSIN